MSFVEARLQCRDENHERSISGAIRSLHDGKRCENDARSEKYIFVHIDFTLDYVRRNGFFSPLVFRNKEGLDMRLENEYR